MQHGFVSIKDILDVVVVPLVIFLLGVFWLLIQARYRCGRFKLLAHRELEEIGPHPDTPVHGSWKKHLAREFVHKQIIESPSDNRDFILGLKPEFVYWLSQLWSAYKYDDPDQWVYYLSLLSTHRYTKSNKLLEAVPKWKKLIADYKAKP
jgi:hypothetical protein